VDADYAGVRQGRVILERALQAMQCVADELSSMTLVYSEMATNIVQHSVPSASKVSLLLRCMPSRWVLQISHNGGDWDSALALHNSAGMSNEIELDESGRGLPIIRQLIEDATYQASDKNRQQIVSLLFKQSSVHIDKPVVLLVEDDVSQRLLFKDWLIDRYEVYDFPLATEAIEKIHDIRPDLVLSDVKMPGMDGLTMREKMKLDPQLDLIPFIFFTADNDIETRHHAAILGIDDYLNKPVQKDRLLQTIERVMQRYHGLVAGLSDRIDRHVSTALQPALPDVIGDYRVVVKSHNGGVGGGDFIFHSSHKDADCLLLADIMGHDETAKFFSYAHAGYLRGLMQGLQGDMQIEALLQQLSDGLYNDALYAQTTLTTVGVELRAGGQISLAAGGHPPPILINDAGYQYLPVEGCMPGLQKGQRYEPVKINLQIKDKLFLYTDGWRIHQVMPAFVINDCNTCSVCLYSVGRWT